MGKKKTVGSAKAVDYKCLLDRDLCIADPQNLEAIQRIVAGFGEEGKKPQEKEIELGKPLTSMQIAKLSARVNIFVKDGTVTLCLPDGSKTKPISQNKKVVTSPFNKEAEIIKREAAEFQKLQEEKRKILGFIKKKPEDERTPSPTQALDLARIDLCLAFIRYNRDVRETIKAAQKIPAPSEKKTREEIALRAQAIEAFNQRIQALEQERARQEKACHALIETGGICKVIPDKPHYQRLPLPEPVASVH